MRTLSIEHRAKLSKIAKERGFGLWMIGKKASPETKKKMREALLHRREKFGYHITDDGRRRMSQAFFKGGKAEFICPSCGQTFKRYRCMVKNLSPCCSKSCAERARRGEKAAHWKGGVGNERHVAMSRLEYKNWRLSVFERDHFTCQLCGMVGGKLQADHVLSWRDHPEWRYNSENGRTLCRKCHKASFKQRDFLHLVKRCALPPGRRRTL